MKRVLSALLAVCTVFSVYAVQAATPRELKWDDLIPKLETLKDPLASLTADQAIDFDIMAAFRQEGLFERTPENEAAFEDARKSEESLRQQGVDVDAVYLEYQKWQREKEKQNNMLVTTLNGSTVRIAGYLLPLDFSEEGTSEFLLVPYIGACIHVPPPPPNQLVFVKLKQSYKSDGLFEPVWVTGQIATKRTEQTLALSDGSSQVPVGYTLSGLKIEPYVVK